VEICNTGNRVQKANSVADISITSQPDRSCMSSALQHTNKYQAW